MSSNNSYETNVSESIKVFWSQSGGSRFSNSTEALLTADILSENVKEINQPLLENFVNGCSENVLIQACAACGIRIVGEQFSPWPVSALGILEMQQEPSSAFSTFYLSFNSGLKYFLYPNLIDHDENAYLCPSCDRYVKKGNLPPFSLAAGVDFGDSSKLPDPPNILEKLILARILVMGKIFKLLSRSHMDPQLALSGHVIAVPFASPLKFEFNNLDLQYFAKVIFVGPSKNWDFLKQRYSCEFKIRQTTLKAWADILKSIHPSFSDFTFPPMEVLEKLHETLFNDAIASFDNVSIGIESSSSSLLTGETTLKGLESVMVTADHTSKPDSDLFHQISSSLGITVHPDLKNLPNEFENLDQILYDAFPWLFCFGSGIPTKKVHSESFLRYLFMHHSNRFATDMDFLFYMFNFQMRKKAAQSMSIKVKSDQKSVEEFTTFTRQDSFRETITKAVQNPLGSDARTVIAKLKPLIQTGSANIPFSPAQRNYSLSRLYGYCHFFGLPSVFFTLSPSDVDSVPIMRLSFTQNDNNDCNGVSFIIPSLASRHKLLAQNPVAAALIFDRVQQYFFSSLFGLAREHEQRKSTLPDSRGKGCFGTPLSFFSVTECQGRGSLHMHALLWCGFPPWLLQKLCSSSLMKPIIEVLDSMFKAALPTEAFARRSELEYERPALRLTSQREDFEKRVQDVVLLNNVHSHSKTCCKPPQGRTGCRMMYPQKSTQATKVFQLRMDKASGIISADPSIEKLSLTRNSTSFLSCPVDLPDNRVVMIELKRPTTADENIVTYSPVCSAALSCNTAAYPLCNSSQAKSVLFYILKYITKDASELANSLSCLREAVNHTRAYPSSADNSGTLIRSGQHVLTRFLNNISSKFEISAQMAASIVLGYNSTNQSHDVWWCFPWPFMKMHPLENPMTNFKIPSSCNDFAIPSSTKTFEYMDDLFHEDSYHSHSQEFSSLEIGSTNEPIIVAQHTSYLLRGKDLALLSFYEYCGCVSIIKKGNLDTMHPKKGRKRNGVFQFDSKHPLFSTHCQRLRSKLCIPLLAGRPPPRHPGPFVDTEIWLARTKAWTEYVITVFFPWDTETHSPALNSYEDLCKWMELSTTTEATSVDIARYRTICNISCSLQISNHHKRMVAIWRGRNRTTWGAQHREMKLNEDIKSTLAPPDFVSLARTELDLFALQQNSIESRETIVNEISNFFASVSNDFQFSPSQPVNFKAIIFSSDTSKTRKLVENLKLTFNDDEGCDLHSPSFRELQLERTGHVLNERQQQIMSYVEQWLKKPLGNPLRILLHGGPGTGKTFVIRSICSLVGNENVLNCAPTGVAASNMSYGRTLHSAFSIPVAKSKSNNNATRLTPLSGIQLNQSRLLFQNKKLIIIDEVSMLDPLLLSSVSCRLSQIFNSELPFGGLSIVLAGDFYQLEPVGAISFPKACSDPELCPVDGVQLFTTFRKFELLQQMRAPDDLQHQLNIDAMRTEGKLTAKVLDSIEPLTRQDIIDDDLWNTAPVIVATNVERHAVNNYKLKQQAIRLNLPILTWTHRLTNSEISPMLTKHSSLFADLTFSFMPGAPCTLTSNICPANGLANGTDGVLHSLTFNSALESQEVRQKLSKMSRGEELEIPIPFAVNVLIPSRNNLLVPILIAERPQYQQVHGVKFGVFPFPLNIAYSLTYHKVQGKTLDRAILSFNGKVGFHEYLVGTTRVRKSKHMRKLPLNNYGNRLKLLKTRSSPYLQHWLESYDDNGYYKASTSKLAQPFKKLKT